MATPPRLDLELGGTVLNISKCALENLFFLLGNRISEDPELFLNWFLEALLSPVCGTGKDFDVMAFASGVW